MKVIFLDFNGVLDTYEHMDEIDPSNLQRLKYIADITNAKVVISSSLKNSYYYLGHLSTKLQNIIKELENNNIKVIDITPQANNREEEIQLYLASHPEIENFCILDDDYEMPSLKNNLVKLPNQMWQKGNGLEDIHMNRATEILNNFKQNSYRRKTK